ncbi:MAG TPA: thioredoxin domain-containing protein [Bryobacteraceae bacterium]|nr:thioredoxin domain-containing protein [Bryobacteraceae bacterium]
MKTVAFLLVCIGAFAQTKPAAPAPEKSAFDKATLEAYLRHVELWVPQVNVKIDDAKPAPDMPGYFAVTVHLSFNGGKRDEFYYVSKDGHQIFKGSVYDINRSPFQSNLDLLKTDLQPSFGPAGAPVVLVVFSDFECPICKEESTVLRQNVAATFPDKVRVYFNDFPLDAIHTWAHTAAIAGRCVFRQNPTKFWNYFDWIYQNQQSIGLDNFSSRFQSFASENGLDGMQLGRCVDNKMTDAEVTKSIEEGYALQVSATPTIFLNGRKLEGGVPWQTLEQLINIELEHQAKSAEAGEKCCEVTIPKIVK